MCIHRQPKDAQWNGSRERPTEVPQPETQADAFAELAVFTGQPILKVPRAHIFKSLRHTERHERQGGPKTLDSQRAAPRRRRAFPINDIEERLIVSAAIAGSKAIQLADKAPLRPGDAEGVKTEGEVAITV